MSSTTDVLFTRTDPALGTFSVRPLDPFADAGLLHGWVTHPKAAFWMMQEASLPDVEREYMRIAAHAHHEAFIGLHDGRPAFLMERYDPSELELVGLYDPEPGDVGMHFLVAPSETPCTGSPARSSPPSWRPSSPTRRRAASWWNRTWTTRPSTR